MRLTLVLVAISCLVLSITASPIQIVEKSKAVQPAATVPNQARQNEAAPPAVEDDDDDDDDDEEDIADVLEDDDDDDDDDDDEEAAADDDDDDEDDDYFERFFDDILGDDDDDDDDEGDVSPSTGSQSPVADSPAQAAQQVAGSSPSISIGEESAVGANEDGLGEVDEAAADGIVSVDNNIDTIAKEPEVQGTVAAAPVQNYVDEDDDDDDDDDDDVLDDALDVEEEDDDDDDDDDDDLGEVLEARKARSTQDVVPVELTQKYNKMVDRILNRIKATMARSYDPVSVHLTNFDHRMKNRQRENARGKDASTETATDSASEEPTTVKSTESSTDKALPSDGVIPEARQNKKSTKKNEKSREKTKQANARPVPKGTLFGLSKVTRKGDVKINRMADYESVKCDIILGPLQLKVEKNFGRGLRRELRLATATTQEMNGRITLRVVNGAATLHSIKVQQPKQVRIDSPDNHDKTREFIWKRSSKIAPIASRKLTTALKAMLNPPPKNKTV